MMRNLAEDFPVLGKKQQQKKVQEYQERLAKMAADIIDLLIENDATFVDFENIYNFIKEKLNGTLIQTDIKEIMDKIKVDKNN